MNLTLPAWPPDWPEIRSAAAQCVASGDWGRYASKTVAQTTKRIAEFTGAGSVRMCCSGSAAVELGLRAAGVGPGDEVITAALDYPGNVRAIELLGGRPVLVDLADQSPCIDADGVEKAGSDSVKAVIASHLFGVPADIVRLKSICDDRGWVLIEDACQVAGMTIDGRSAGTIGHVGVWSLGGSKLLSCGSGGVIFANDDRTAARLAPVMDRPSDAFGISPLAAAVLHPQLDRLAEMNTRRSQTAVELRDQVFPHLAGVTWYSGQRDESAFYKVAFTVGSDQERLRVIDAAEAMGLPLGAGFRSLARTSPRRCRKPVSLDRSEMLGQRLVVLDHRALMIDPERRDELAAAIRSLLQ
ncbi:L-glutamine:2-deoxy-scyllo-inosose aminotransferase [Rubripirellula lacrimiformis]|uniref:L-glutamine:2-deoxy-scyllo-inosose aminotransferase n=1 Tax=Rubripirellula lacrimiformis TaxID=1930273 RepID=A0A517NFE3_9BACT|nr:aminotransferase class I/II-fold pyridoxal phosphate-dependent enzyme [Rubripirellula lacrimiformis]QDT05851.1 L-glutamine:2-deoxy-scyllo-inosose aminotransferase [Rubripirellula lacrimiformis]